MGFVSNLFTLAGVSGVPFPDWGWLGAILNFINGIIGNAGWTMVIFTVLLKLVTFPLDYYSRYKMKKNAVIMEDMKPQLEKLEKQCKGDKQLYNARMLPLLKKEGYSVGGACLPMLVTIVLFIFVFSGLNSYATYRNADTYNQLAAEYNRQVNTADNGGLGLDPVADKEEINAALLAKYDTLNPSWLWVKNPWRPDVSYTDINILKFVAGVNPVASYEEFTHTGGKTNYGLGAIQINAADTQLAAEEYESIIGPIAAVKGIGNGYYILIVIAVGVSYLSQYITQKTQNSTAQNAASGMSPGTMKFMLIFFPLLLGIFAFSYSAVFTLYIITNSLISLIATIGINYIVEEKMKRLKEKKLAQIKYRR